MDLKLKSKLPESQREPQQETSHQMSDSGESQEFLSQVTHTL